MKKLPFGLRVYVLGLLSFILTDLVFQAFVSLDYDPRIRAVFHQMVSFVYLIVLGRILKARAGRIIFLSYLASAVYVAFVLVRTLYELYLIGSISTPLPAAVIALLPPLLLYWWEWLKEFPFYRMYLQGLGGSAKFGSIKSFQNHPAKLAQPLIPITDKGVTASSIFIGRTLFRHDPMPRLIGIEDENHMVTVAPARTGKSVSTIYNVAGTYQGDMIFLDVKGEHTRTSFYRRCSQRFLEKRGIRIPEGVKYHFENGEGIVLDPCGKTPVPSSFYNPLSEIDIHADDCREMIAAIADGCILSEKQKHFEEIPKKILKGLIAYVLGRFPNEPRKHTLPYILDLLTGINAEGFADKEVFDELLLDMRVCKAGGGLAQEAASLIGEMGQKEKGGHLGVLSRGLEWVGDPAMRKHLIKSDFKFSDIGTKVNTKGAKVIQSVYIVLPDTRMDELKRWMRVLLAVSSVAMRKRKHHPDHRTLFMLDEFPLLGNIKTIADGFGLLPGYHQKFWIFAQSLGQLKSHYPSYWNAMIAQSTAQFFGQPSTDMETLDFISKSLGHHNMSHADLEGLSSNALSGPRDLLTPSEISALIGKGQNKQIVFPSGGFPLLLERLTFKSMKIGGKRFGGLPLGGLKGHFPNHKKS